MAIHGDKSQQDRDYVLADFRSGRTHILVATDVAARGLDVDDVKFVINYDYPQSSEDYVHRIGRTGRSSNTGTSYTFFTPSNAKQASDLVSVLQEAGQEVSPMLYQLAEMARSGAFGKGGRSRFRMDRNYDSGPRRERGGGFGRGGSRGGSRGSRMGGDGGRFSGGAGRGSWSNTGSEGGRFGGDNDGNSGFGGRGVERGGRGGSRGGDRGGRFRGSDRGSRFGGSDRGNRFSDGGGMGRGSNDYGNEDTSASYMGGGRGGAYNNERGQGGRGGVDRGSRQRRESRWGVQDQNRDDGGARPAPLMSNDFQSPPPGYNQSTGMNYGNQYRQNMNNGFGGYQSQIGMK